MKTKKNKTSILLIALCLLAGSSQLWGRSTFRSAFIPQLHSSYRAGFLTENPSYFSEELQPENDGLSHPFRSLHGVQDALYEVFSSHSRDHDLFSYRHPLLKADLNVYAGYEADFPENGDYDFWYKGWRLTAEAGQNVFLRTDWYHGAYHGDLNLAETDELIDGYYKRFTSHIQLDNISGELAYRTDKLNLALGRGRFQIGNSISGSIILNDKVNDYAYLLAEAHLGDFRLSMMHGSLVADSVYASASNSSVNALNYPDKYVALHQLSYFPLHSLELFVGESVVYGNRAIDLNYILPNSFWRATEHNQHDRDNVMIYCGGNYAPVDGTLIYAQFALDEFSYSKFFTNWWGNKYALQTGISQAIPTGRISLEASAVRPYTYAHYMNHTMYSHDGRPLGYPQGSNLVDVSLEANLGLLPYCLLDSRLSWRKRGSDGASWQDNYHDIFTGQIDDAQATWFMGDQSNEYQLCSSLTIPILAHNRLLIGHDSLHRDKWEHKLFAAWQFIY
ncbi:MAG: hypothetical protein PHO85_01975 [Candidatus Cloacimonetes bacterium]|nr:hypothetical protein [Candidatus Cloacimonadota bacterium]